MKAVICVLDNVKTQPFLFQMSFLLLNDTTRHSEICVTFDKLREIGNDTY